MMIKAKPGEIAKARLTEQMSQNALAEKADISATTVSLLETGKQAARPETAKKICGALNKDFNSLFTVEK